MSTSRDRVLVAMSGGVDSAVAAGLLLEEGYDVTGVFLCLKQVQDGRVGNSLPTSTVGDDSRGQQVAHPTRSSDESGRGEGKQADDAQPARRRACCSPQDAADARQVAALLGIELISLPVFAAFERVIDQFAAEYARGRTPNPCVLCNSAIKFGRLFDLADSCGARYVATGHYARIVNRRHRPAIARAACRAKDQSYALFGVDRARLERVLLPAGELASKEETRRLARQLGLPVHDKPDSQDVCFVSNNDYTSLLARLAPQALRAGEVVDSSGNVLGRHDGYARFTIGQRRGVGVAAGAAMYVTDIDPQTARVTIGPREQVMHDRLWARGTNWHTDVGEQFDATVQIRYNHCGAPGTVHVTGRSSFEVAFDEPVSAITPGQAAVVYDGNKLLGGGWIEASA